MSACGVTPNTGPAPRRTRRTFAVCRPLGVIPTALPLLPFTAIRSSFWVSVRPSGPFSPLTGEERRCCGQRPHRCRGIWRPPGRACPDLGQGRAGRSEAACRLGQTKIVEATAACSGFARCSCGASQAGTALGWLCLLSSRRGSSPPGALVVSVHRGDRHPHCRHGVPGFWPGRPVGR